MSSVFVPQLPHWFDSSNGTWVPSIDIEPAKEFGELKIMMPPGSTRFDTQQQVDIIRKAMDGFKEGDFILAIGSPVAIAITAALADRITSPIKFLQWDKIQKRYIAVTIDLESASVSS